MVEHLSHDELLEALLKVRSDRSISLQSAAAFFIRGVAGTLPRGRTVLLDYLRLQRLMPHRFRGDRHCEICGLPAEATIDSGRALTTAYAGHASNEVIEHVLPRWIDMMNLTEVSPRQEEREVLEGLIALIEQAGPDETHGQLEKRIAKARLLPRTDKYKRHGILQTLAECGVMPNALITPLYEGLRTQKEFWAAHRALRGTPRSDIVLPLAGWRGSLGVNRERYSELFVPKG